MNNGLAENNPFPIPAKGLAKGYEDHFVQNEYFMEAVNTSLQSLRNPNYPPHNLLFVGERGAGKSSVFDYLREIRCGQLGIIPVELNAIEEKLSVGLIFERVVNAIRRISVDQYGLYKLRRVWWGFQDFFPRIETAWLSIDINTTSRRFEKDIENGRKTLTNHLRVLIEERNISGILIMIDDADGLGENSLGRLGYLFSTLSGFLVYLAMGSTQVIPSANETDSIPRIDDVATGVLAYWEHVPVYPFEASIIEKIILSYSRIDEGLLLSEEENNKIAVLSGGNPRLAMLLANKSYAHGLEIQNNTRIMHVTREAVIAAKNADLRLAEKLRWTEQVLLERDRDSLPARWW